MVKLRSARMLDATAPPGLLLVELALSLPHGPRWTITGKAEQLGLLSSI